MVWQAEQNGLGNLIMVTLGCNAAERLLHAYLQAIRDVNKANLEYARALKKGSGVPAKAKIARDVTERLRVARQAFQLHRRRHRC
jgi:hypothetical protein